MKLVTLSAVLLAAATGFAQETSPAAEGQQPAKNFRVEAGTRIPLNLINSISTRSSAPGDRVYLETAFPVVIDGAIVIPPGSYVAGTITSVKRAGRVKGRAELFVRFDSLTLPNGVTRDFRGAVDKLDGTNTERLDKDEGVIRGDSNKGDDAVRVAETAGWGTTVGALAGRSAKGAGIGAAAGATAGLVGVLLTRGPDAVLERGTTIEMVLDRPVFFQQSELDFGNYQSRPLTSGPGEQPRRRGWMGRY